MIDALESLVKLRDDMPGWLEKADFLKHAARLRYTGFAKMSETMALPPSLRKKTGSVESMRPQDDGEHITTPEITPEADISPPLAASLRALQSTAPTTPQTPGRINIDPRNRHLFREVRELRRKRKSPSLKDGQSGPQRTRARRSLVVYYDSSIQEGFEDLVRSISSARSVLRKARTAVSLRPKVTALKQDEHSIGQEGTYAYQMPTIARRDSPTGVKTGLETFDELDRDLEAAQTFCEVGAHQALRDGDCFEELDDVKAFFEKCITAIGVEIHILKKQEDVMRILRSSTSYTPALSAEKRTSTEHQLLPYAEDPAAIAVDGPIEVDDDDASSIIVDLSELPGRRQYSSRHGAKSRGLSSSPGAETRVPASQPAEADKTSEWTRAGKDVPIEAGIALASNIAVGGVAAEEPEIDLAALRSSVPRRRQGMSPPVTDSATKEEPEFDLAAMRKSALKRRGPGPPTAQAGIGASDSSRNTAVKSSLLASHDSSVENSSLAVDHTHGLAELVKAQVA